MKFGRVRGIRAFFPWGPGRVTPACLCWINLQHWTLDKGEKKASQSLSLPLFINILRSSSRHQSEQVSDGVGQESPGTAGLEREGWISVNPPYSLLGEEERNQAAHLDISIVIISVPSCCYNITRRQIFMFVWRYLGWYWRQALTVLRHRVLPQSYRQTVRTRQQQHNNLSQENFIFLSPKILTDTRQFPG